MLEDSDSGQLEDIDVIPNEEMLLVIGFVTNIWLLCLYPSIYAFFFLLLD
jgi:hypothetical protein